MNTLEERAEKAIGSIYTSCGQIDCMGDAYLEDSYEWKDVIAFIQKEIKQAKRELIESVPCEEDGDYDDFGDGRDSYARDIQEWKENQLNRLS